MIKTNSFSDNISNRINTFSFIWYIPIQCAFGNGTDAGSYVREFEYYLDTRTGIIYFNSNILILDIWFNEKYILLATFTLPAGVRWTWVHCDRKFVGYFELLYSTNDWVSIGNALEQKNPVFIWFVFVFTWFLTANLFTFILNFLDFKGIYGSGSSPNHPQPLYECICRKRRLLHDSQYSWRLS